MRNILIAAVVFAAAAFSFEAQAGVIPQPVSVKPAAGRFVFGAERTFAIRGTEVPDLADYVAAAGFSAATRRPDVEFRIGLRNTKVTSDEGYRLAVGRDRIVIESKTEAGAFYGLQTLLQMIDEQGTVECVEVDDSPRYGYRGAMIDVSRHFRSKEFILKQIDAFARFKLNRLHLHLTDAAGWRIEIKKYPRLTDFAAWRTAPVWRDWWAADRRYCEASEPGASGGFYTQDDIREIVEYARRRHVEVIPEIEMPAHSEEVLAAYPELSCVGRPYEAADFCAGNEAVYEFLENVLTEVMSLFPSEYIHIGGDEASKAAWHTCPKCQAAMQREGLADVDELQSYMIRRISKFLAAHGRTAIGWDEILAGGLPDGAVVMSWRGEEGGLKAVSAGHDAIMSPSKYCYIDQPQDAPFTQPLSIGGYLPLEKVYQFAADYPSLTAAEQNRILGVQANLWAEYIPTDEHYETMLYPRVMAIAETGWSSVAVRDYASFRERALTALDRLKADGYTTFDLANEYGERYESRQPLSHCAVGKPVTYANPWHKAYEACGAATLTDGLLGDWTYSDGRWQGFLDSDFDVTVDLGQTMPIHYVGVTFMQSIGPEVRMPAEVSFYVSDDGKEFTLLTVSHNDVPATTPELMFRTFSFAGSSSGRYVRCVAPQNARRGSWLFADEVVIY